MILVIMILLKRFCFGQPWSTKKNICRVNHANFMAKQVSKAVMKRFRNDFLKDRNHASQRAYRK